MRLTCSFRICAMAALTLAVTCGISGRVLAGTVASSAERPNIILIMADDLGAKELACYGHPEHQTPNLDRLARTGVQFHTCYTACICHPTRFEIMTGQYGSTNGIYHFSGRPGGPRKDAPEEQIVNHLTFGQVLQKAGYATALSGKWQLSGKIPTLIHECGFDEYCMWAYKNNLPDGVEYTGGWEGAPGGRTSRYWNPSIVRNGKYIPTTMDDYGPDMFTDFVIEFASKTRNKPFFIYYPMALTHGPAYSTPKSNPNAEEKFRNSKQEKFGENVEYMDDLIGRIIKALDDAKLREKTIVIFTGDNGTGGEGKGAPTELGARVPMIANCPGTVKPIGLTDVLVDTSDVMPTLVELAQTRVPAGHKIDGRSFAPLLLGKPMEEREWIFSYLGDRRVLRTKRWLLERNAPYDFGRLFDCGTSRDGSGYRDVTDSTDPEVLAIKKRFNEILATKPVPELPAAERSAAKKNKRKNNQRDRKKQKKQTVSK